MKNEIRKLIEDLKDMEHAAMKAARDLRKTDHKMSYIFFYIAEESKKAAEELKGRIPMPAELEGGGQHGWFYVCGVCHGNIGSLDKYCRHCGHPIDWSGK